MDAEGEMWEALRIDPVAVSVNCMFTESEHLCLPFHINLYFHYLYCSFSLPPSCLVRLSRLSPRNLSCQHTAVRLMFLKQDNDYVTSMLKYLEWFLAPL